MCRGISTGHSLETIVTVCAKRGHEDKIHQKLLERGICYFIDDDLSDCAWFLIPDLFATGRFRDTPAISVLHREIDSEQVAKTIDAVVQSTGCVRY